MQITPEMAAARAARVAELQLKLHEAQREYSAHTAAQMKAARKLAVVQAEFNEAAQLARDTFTAMLGKPDTKLRLTLSNASYSKKGVRARE